MLARSAVVAAILIAGLCGQTGTVTAIPGGGEPPRIGTTVLPSMAFDRLTHRVVLVQGMLLGSGIDTWDNAGTGWVRQSRLPLTGTLYASNLVWDDAQQAVVIATSTGFSIYLSAWQ